jgi:transcriptional regulator with XRE-family HTH domain
MDKKLYSAIGNEIRAARARLRISQVELASLIKVSEATIVNYEKAHRAVSIEALCHIAAALDCEPGDLIPSVKTFEVVSE